MLNYHESAKSLVIESKLEKKRRLEAQNKHRASRSHKRSHRKYSKHEVDLINSFREIGIDYFSVPRENLFKVVPLRLQGKRVQFFSENAMRFLRENFDVEQVASSDGQYLLNFTNHVEEKPTMANIAATIAEEVGEKRSLVSKVLEQLRVEIMKGLKEDRYVRIPKLFRMKISFRPAKPKRKGRNPFNGQEMMFKAKPASNKLRISPAKELKEFVAELKVVEPVKKSKKVVKKSKKSKK